MTILFTALAIVAAPAPALGQTAPQATPAQHAQHAGHGQHAQHSQPGAKSGGDDCPCCEDMAGTGKMGCCAKHGDGHGAEHKGHSAHH